MVEQLKSVWMDGKLVDWDDAKVPVLTHALHYGTGAFEGIRAYETHDGRPAVFRLKDHIRRLFDSCKILQMDLPYEFDEVCEACKQTLSANGLKQGYIRPVAYLGEGGMGLFPKDNPVRLMIAVWKWGAYLGETAISRGIRTKISSFVRFNPNSMMTCAKLTGNYITSVLAKREAVGLGYDEAILLDPEGFAVEGSGENLFLVRDGKIKTSPLTGVLPGLTRATIIEVAGDLGYTLTEERFTPDELYLADEAFFTGTAAEVTPIREVDDRTIGEGKPGPVTKKLLSTFFNLVQGRESRYLKWLDYFDVAQS